VVLSSFFLFVREKNDRCGRCGNLAFFARFPNPCGRVLCVHGGGSVHIVFDIAEMFNGVITSRPMRVAKKGDTGVAAPLEKIAPGAS
jgi:ribosomal protein S27AE